MSRMSGRDGSFKTVVRPAAVLLMAGVGFVGVSGSAGAADEKADKKPPAAKADAAAKVTYAKDIQPLLKDSCVGCHKAPAPAGRGPGGGGPGGPGGRGPGGPGGGPRGPAGGLRLDDRAQILKGGKHGKAVIPGKAEQSLLYKVLKGPVTVGKDEIHSMPKAKPGQEFVPMADEEVDLVKQWIDQGAK